MDTYRCIGSAYKGLRNYKKAKEYLRTTLTHYENHYGKDHVEIAKVLENLGQVYLLEGDLKAAENFFIRTLEIYQKNNHPSEYKCLESFSELHLKKSQEAIKSSQLKEAEHFKTQAILALKKALAIVQAHFPADSPHIARIQKKLSNLKAINATVSHGEEKSTFAGAKTWIKSEQTLGLNWNTQSLSSEYAIYE